MKKILLFALMLAFAATTQAQEFKKFKVNLGLGYAIPFGRGGLLLDLEPQYAISDKLAVSLRFEIAAIDKDVSTKIGTSATQNAKTKLDAVGSITLGAKYYFYEANKLRVYGGLGLGWFDLAKLTFEKDEVSEEATGTVDSKVGFIPKLGIDFGHFNLELAYNIMGNSELSGIYTGNTIVTITSSGSSSTTIISGSSSTTSSTSITRTMKNSYFGIRVGAFIGGGKK